MSRRPPLVLIILDGFGEPAAAAVIEDRAAAIAWTIGNAAAGDVVLLEQALDNVADLGKPAVGGVGALRQRRPGRRVGVVGRLRRRRRLEVLVRLEHRPHRRQIVCRGVEVDDVDPRRGGLETRGHPVDQRPAPVALGIDGGQGADIGAGES